MLLFLLLLFLFFWISREIYFSLFPSSLLIPSADSNARQLELIVAINWQSTLLHRVGFKRKIRIDYISSRKKREIERNARISIDRSFGISIILWKLEHEG